MLADYEHVRALGAGTFGTVWLGIHSVTGRQYAVKEVAIKASMTSRDRDQALTEVSTLSRCNHVNIIRCKDAFVDQSALYIIMEFADGGDLKRKIKNQEGVHFDENVVLRWFVQLLYALRYIHGQHILHRDLKCENVFVTRGGVVKVGDFGIARVLADRSDLATTAVGTPYYLCPEICARRPYNQKGDMWAAGCVLYELCCLQPPFRADGLGALIGQILGGTRQPLPSQYSALPIDLVRVLLRPEPDERPDAVQLLAVPALQPYVLEYLCMIGITIKPSRGTPRRSSSSSSPQTEQPKACDQKSESPRAVLARAGGSIREVPTRAASPGFVPSREESPLKDLLRFGKLQRNSRRADGRSSPLPMSPKQNICEGFQKREKSDAPVQSSSKERNIKSSNLHSGSPYTPLKGKLQIVCDPIIIPKDGSRVIKPNCKPNSPQPDISQLSPIITEGGVPGIDNQRGNSPLVGIDSPVRKSPRMIGSPHVSSPRSKPIQSSHTTADDKENIGSPAKTLYQDMIKRKRVLNQVDQNVVVSPMKQSPCSGTEHAFDVSPTERKTIKLEIEKFVCRMLYETSLLSPGCDVLQELARRRTVLSSLRAALASRLGTLLMQTTVVVVRDGLRRGTNYPAVEAKIKNTRAWPYMPLIIRLVEGEQMTRGPLNSTTEIDD